MLTRVGQVLVLVAVILCTGCTAKKHKGVKQESPVVREKVETVNVEESAESEYEKFERLLLESQDEAGTYKMLRGLASNLRSVEQTFGRAEEASKLAKELESISKDPETKRLRKELEDLNREVKEWYDKMAILYNKKMVELNFKFAEPAGLPPGQTETLPRVFPIR